MKITDYALNIKIKVLVNPDISYFKTKMLRVTHINSLSDKDISFMKTIRIRDRNGNDFNIRNRSRYRSKAQLITGYILFPNGKVTYFRYSFNRSKKINKAFQHIVKKQINSNNEAKWLEELLK